MGWHMGWLLFMATEEREKWDRRYRDPEPPTTEPSELVTGLAPLLPTKGQALDVAGGAGRHAIWLAQRGLDVTVADISRVGLALARQRAQAVGLDIRTQGVDFETEPIPPGPWDLILCVHFLERCLFPQFAESLRGGGVLVYLHPTRTNLERHAKPPAPFLLEEGELRELAAGLDIIRYDEAWRADGRHQALLVARR